MTFSFKVQGLPSNTKWLTFIEAEITLEELFDDIHIPFDCDFLAAQREAATGKVLVSGMYKIDTTRPLQIYSVATWYPNERVYWSTFPFRHKTEGLQGTTIKGAYMINVSTQPADHYACPLKSQVETSVGGRVNVYFLVGD
jgi:hypothetical protein